MDFRRLKLVAICNLGFCKIDLWELEEAMRLFQIYKENCIYENIFMENYSKIPLDACLAFLHTYLSSKEKAFEISEDVYNNYLSSSDSRDWNQLLSLIFLGSSYKNLGLHQRSFSLYQEALVIAKERNFDQALAKAMYGLAGLYREQHEFGSALSCHLKSIDLLERLDAKSDLAEAYHQLGLTHQVMREFEKSNTNFHNAIRLFTEMEAPKQVERVRRSMQNEK